MAETPNSYHTEKEAPNSSKPLSPQLKVEPASEWANDTFSALDPANLAIPPTSPSLNFPGSYPYSPTTLEPGPTLEEIKEAAHQYIHAVGQFVPSHEDVQKIAHSASNTVREYFPNNISTYLGPMNPTQEAIPTSPLEESETSPSSGGGFVLINRGTSATKDESQSVSESEHAVGDKPAQVPSELSDTPRPKLRILEPKYSKNDTNSIQTDLASENASMKVLPGSKAASIRLHDSVPTPYSYTYRYGNSRSASNSGAIFSNGHTDQHMSDIHEGVKAQDNNKEHDVVPGPLGDDSGTGQKLGIESGTIPVPEDGFPASIDNEGSKEEPESFEMQSTTINVGKQKEERELEEVGIKQDEQTNTLVEGVTVGGKPNAERLTEARRLSAEEKTSRNTDDLSSQLSPNTPVKRVGPIATTTDRENATGASEATEVPPAETKQKQKDALKNENAQLQSPKTNANTPLVARAMSGPDARKISDPSPRGNAAVNPSKGQKQNSGRKKGSFVQRLKTWSKKLGQNKKGQNEDHTTMV